ncbi:hypothetical protein AFL94_17035 [Arthrobacter sp. LS16]|nr:hypothetical protein AFL94_17035 [Arthrobacter sp. LS16]
MSLVVEFIDEFKNDYGIEPIIRALEDTSAQFAASSYYAHKTRPKSQRAIRDEKLVPLMRKVFEENYCCYGARKMWHSMNREHSTDLGPIVRCTIERLMPVAGLHGISRRRKRPATKSMDPADALKDLVKRQFTAQGPNGLWVADITYIPTQAGWVYAAFVLDAATREIVGWQVTNHMKESLATDALTMALAARYRAGDDTTGLIHHSDRGVQYRSIKYGETLGEAKAFASVGAKGDSYDNAMAEALNSVFKAELIDRKSWSGLIEVMAETSAWVGWYNTQRLHSSLGYTTPREAHQAYVALPAAA